MVQNTSNQSFTLKSMAGTLYCQEYMVGNVSSFIPVTIYPNSENTIYVKVNLSPLGIVNQIISAFTNSNFSMELLLDVYVNVDNNQSRFKFPYKVGIQ